MSIMICRLKNYLTLVVGYVRISSFRLSGSPPVARVRANLVVLGRRLVGPFARFVDPHSTHSRNQV